MSTYREDHCLYNEYTVQYEIYKRLERGRLVLPLQKKGGTGKHMSTSLKGGVRGGGGRSKSFITSQSGIQKVWSRDFPILSPRPLPVLNGRS